MKARQMKHDGKTKIVVPAEVSRYFDPELNDYVSQELTPEREIDYDLPAGTKYGGYPVRKVVFVPIHAQNALYKKGFKFVNKKDEDTFLAERQRIEAAIKERAKDAKAEVKVKSETKKAEVEEPAPSGDLTIGKEVAPKVKKEKDAGTPPTPNSTGGGN